MTQAAFERGDWPDTFRLLSGQIDSIVKAVHNPASGEAEVLGVPDFHGDPVRPSHRAPCCIGFPVGSSGSSCRPLALRRPGCITSPAGSTGLLGSDLPGVLVIEAQR